MAWSKIKTIIIVILLILNLFLLCLVSFLQIRSARYEASALTETIAILARNGIQTEKGVLPSTLARASCSLTRDTEREAQVASLLLGDDTAFSSSGGLHLYTSEAGSANFRSNGEFSVTLSLSSAGYDSYRDHAEHLLQTLGVESWYLTQTGNTVTATQCLDGMPVFSSTGIVFSYQEDGTLATILGRIFLGKIAADSELPDAISVSTALLAFLDYAVENGDVCRSIDGMVPGYLIAALSDPIRLTPVWVITTDTADYYLDPATGEVTRLTQAAA